MMNDLGTLGGSRSSAEGINAEGLVVGEAQAVDGTWHAFLWEPESGMKQLDIPVAVSSKAIAINDSAQVVGEFTDADGEKWAFIWTAGDGAQVIPVLYAPFTVEDINASGQVLITAYDSDDTNADLHIIVWSASDGLLDLDSPYPQELVNVCTITDSGDIIGYSTDAGPMAGCFEFSFILSQDGRITDLPSINTSESIDGENDCRVYNSNKLGQIVGEIDYTKTETHAWLWTPRNMEIVRQKPVRVEISFTIVDKRGSVWKYKNIPHEEMTFMQKDDHTVCRFTAIDSKGRPKEIVLKLEEGMCFDKQGERTLTYYILENLRGKPVRTYFHVSKLSSYEMTDIGMLDGLYACGLSINNASQVVGSGRNGEGFERAFFWSRDTGILDIGTLGGQNSCAEDINDEGTVVGWAENSQGQKRAFTWHQSMQ